MTKKVALIYPPSKLYQRGEDRCQANIEDSSSSSMRACNDLGYAAAVLLDKGYEVFLRDYQTEHQGGGELVSDLSREKCDFICLSTTNATVFDDIEVLKKLKKLFPNMKMILKGSIFYDPEQNMLDLLDLSVVDCLIGGEIDFCIGGVIDSFCGREKIESIPNIVYKKPDGSWVKTRFHTWNDNLDDAPFPNRHLMNNSLYVRPDTGRPMATIQTSRGCPASCIYCLSPCISGKKVRQRSPENVLAEIKECYYSHNIKDFFFKADTFTIDRQWVEKFCNLLIASDLNGKIAFTANSRVRPITKSTLELMKKAGCFAVAFGFESGSDRSLKLMKKGTTTENNRQAMKWAKEVGLQVYGFWMIGFPWETREDIEETRKHIFELNADFIEVHIALPHYGTELYKQCKQAGVLSNSVLGGDYFHAATTGTTHVSMAELLEIRKSILLHYYLRPSYILDKVWYGLKRPVILKNYVRYGLRMLKNLSIA